METGIPEPLFAVPRVTAATDEDGALVIRSAEPLAGYPVTVMHSVRAWAAADPGHPMVAERSPVAAGGPAATARRRPPRTPLARGCLTAGSVPGGRCWCCPATAWITCWSPWER
jgi:feruloyl-CoA synthase